VNNVHVLLYMYHDVVEENLEDQVGRVRDDSHGLVVMRSSNESRGRAIYYALCPALQLQGMESTWASLLRA